VPFLQTIFVSLVGAAVLGVILVTIALHKLREKYSLLWFIIALALISIPWFYPLHVKIAHFTGIKLISSYFFFNAVVLLLLLCFQLSVALSSAWKERKELSIQFGLLEERLQRLEKSVSNKEGKNAKPIDGDQNQ